MTRKIAVVLALCMLISLAGCSSNKAEETTAATTEATVEEPAPVSNWKIMYYVDEFGDPSSDGYIVGDFTGNFSNSATTNSDLRALVYIHPSTVGSGYNISFRLAEYGNHVATYTKYDLLNLSYKINGEVYGVELMGTTPNGDLYLFDYYAYEDDSLAAYNKTDRKTAFDTFFNTLKENTGEISCLITIGDMNSIYSSVGGSTYRFKIEGYGLAELLSELESK